MTAISLLHSEAKLLPIIQSMEAPPDLLSPYRYMLTTKKLVVGLLVFWCVPIIITVSLSSGNPWDGVGWLVLIFFIVCLVGMIASYIGMYWWRSRFYQAVCAPLSMMESK